MDISSIKGESFGQSKLWLQALDDCTDCINVSLLKKKSETAQKIESFIIDLEVSRGS